MSQKKKETASHRERLMSDEERTQVMSDEEGRLTEVFYDEHQHDVLDATGHHDLTPLLPHDANHEPVHGATPHRRDPKFYATVLAIEAAINEDIHPKRIVQGSSGSYFCRNRDKKIVGVFKPKDEEPYGPLNPKWGKYFQKNLCCCMYGRACLVANQGYLSEAGASIVDSSLGLNIVPKTKVVRFVSTSFHYSKVTRTKTNAVKNASQRFPQIGKRLRQGLPPKTGSLQMFVNGYKDATIVLKQLNLEALQPATRAHLQHLFEKLVILDYLTRNTDRGNDNWLIKYVPPAEGEEESIDIAAIDNGLSFPFKHPDEWRSYPYEWQWGPLAKIKFSDHTCAEFLPKIENDDFIEELVDQLYVLFSQDNGFRKSTFDDQMAVMRGQVLNLRRAMRDRLSPAELTAMPTAKLYVQNRPAESSGSFRGEKSIGNRIRRKYHQILTQKGAFFKWC